jgi:hypothetical protein
MHVPIPLLVTAIVVSLLLSIGSWPVSRENAAHDRRIADFLAYAWIVGLLVFYVCIGYGAARGTLALNPPAPSPAVVSQQSQNQRPPDQQSAASGERGTEKTPLIVRLEKTDEDRDTAKKYERQADESAALQQQQGTFSLLLTVFSAATIVVIVIQLLIMRGQRDAQRSELRAYVALGPNLDKDPIPDTEYTLVFNYTNRGKTPALRIGFRGSIWQVSLPLDMNTFPEIPPGFDEDRGSLHADEGLHHRGMGIHAETRKKFSIPEVNEVLRGTHAFVVGIKVRYTDVFSQEHETQEFWLIRYQKGERTRSLVPGKNLIG